MELSVYNNNYFEADTINNFLDYYNFIQLKHMASDLLGQGLSPDQITDAVMKAIKIGRSSGLKIQKHFLPVFTDLDQNIIKDCKLSELAYGLVLLNANPDLTPVGKWQIKVLEKYFK